MTNNYTRNYLKLKKKTDEIPTLYKLSQAFNIQIPPTVT